MLDAFIQIALKIMSSQKGIIFLLRKMRVCWFALMSTINKIMIEPNQNICIAPNSKAKELEKAYRSYRRTGNRKPFCGTFVKRKTV
jgi:hypothetical protein